MVRKLELTRRVRPDEPAPKSRCATCGGQDLGDHNGHINCERCGQKHLKLQLVVRSAAA